jgi:large subunit ribosomal protein L29
MKIVDIRTKTDDELKDQLVLLAKEQYNLRFQRASGQLENTARVGAIRHTIARIKTVQGERMRGVKIETKKVAKGGKKKAE